MGMEAVLVQVTPAQLEQFRESPRLWDEYAIGGATLGDEFADFEASAQATFDRMGLSGEMRKEVERHFRAKVKRSIRPKPAKTQKPESDRRVFSLNKDWHVMHYALNGTAQGGTGLLGYAVLGDKSVTEIQGFDSYGPARYLTPSQVKGVLAELHKVEPSALVSKLDVKDAARKQIYLGETLKDPNEWYYLPELFEEFRSFYADAAGRGNAMVIKII